MEKILVTGWSGFLGSVLLPILENNYTVVKFLGDISNYENVLDQIQDDITKVVHLAGLISGNDKDLIKVNVLGTLNLLEALKEKPPKCLNFFLSIGSASEFSFTKDRVNEDMLKQPSTMYGKTKLMSSDLIYSWYKYSSTPTVIFRPFNIIGPNQPFRMLPRKLQMFFSRNTSEAVIENVNVNSVRDWIDVNDVCSAIKEILSKELNVFSEINFGKGEPVSNLALIEVFANVWNKKFHFSESNFLTDSVVCDNSKFCTLFPNFKFKFSLEESVNQIKKSHP
ncbi:MAG: NAD(P)-dependent oxidoreductase [bacterium]